MGDREAAGEREWREMREGGRDKETTACASVRVCPSHYLPLFGRYRSVDGFDVGEWVWMGGGG